MPQPNGSRAALVFAVLIAVAASPGDRAFAAPPNQALPAPDASDDDFLFIDRGVNILLSNGPHDAGTSDWVTFETDDCGTLHRVQNRNSVVRRSALSDDLLDDEDDDPVDQLRQLFGRWLAIHSEIAVTNDAIDKWCGNDLWFDEEDDPADSIA